MKECINMSKIKELYEEWCCKPEVVVFAEEDTRDFEYELALAKAKGYAECFEDLCKGMKNMNSFALVSVSPVVGELRAKAHRLVPHKEEGK
jgi:hypothetical protein